MNNQDMYDIVETVVSENEDVYSLIQGNETKYMEMADELEELFETGEYNKMELKQHVQDTLEDNEIFALNEYGVDEKRFEECVLIADDVLGRGAENLRYVLENHEQYDTYRMEMTDFIEYLITEFQILGEVSEKVLPFINHQDVYHSLVRFDYAEVPNLGFVYTTI